MEAAFPSPGHNGRENTQRARNRSGSRRTNAARVPLVATFSSFVVFVGLLLLLEHNAVHGRAIATVRPPREHVTKVHEHAPRPVRRFHPCRLVHVRCPAGSGGARVEGALLNLLGCAGRLLREEGLVISLRVDWLSAFLLFLAREQQKGSGSECRVPNTHKEAAVRVRAAARRAAR